MCQVLSRIKGNLIQEAWFEVLEKELCGKRFEIKED